MSKTLGQLLATVAIIAIQFIPGLGQAATIALTLAVSAASAMLFRPTIPKSNPPETAKQGIKVETPPRVAAYGRSRLYGACVLWTNTDYSVESEIFSPFGVDAWAIHDGRISQIVQRYLGDDAVELAAPYDPDGLPTFIQPLPSGAYRAPNIFYGVFNIYAVRWYETLGETPGTAAFGQFLEKVPEHWTENHRGDGVVVIGLVWRPVSAEDFPETYPQGAVEPSIAADWQLVFDPRDPAQDVSDPDTWQWSENAVLHLLHYRLVREKAYRESGAQAPTGAALQMAWDVFFAPTVDYWTEAADVADEAVALKGGGTEPRYRSCVAHKLTDSHKEVIKTLVDCFDGWTCPRADGALVVYAGKFYEPTVSIGPEHIVAYSWQRGVRDEDAINEIKLTYTSAAHEYTTPECDPWRDETDIAERGQIRSHSLANQVPSHGQARRLAKRLIARAMSPNRGTCTTNVAGRIVRGERYINLRIEEAGALFFDGVAEIVTLTRNVETGGVTFDWVEVTANIDAWEEDTEEGNPAATGAVTVLPTLDAPVITSATLIFDPSSTEGTGTRIRVTLDGPSGLDLKWFLRWRRIDDAVWNEQQYVDIDSTAGVELISGFVPTNRDLEVEVTYQTGTGQLAPYSSPPTEVATDTSSVAPDDAVAISLVEWTDALRLSTPSIPRATTYRWRFYDGADGTTIKRQILTTGPSVEYPKALAHADGVLRSYVVDVAGANLAGPGGIAVTGVLTNAAPAAVTGVAAADGTALSTVTFTPLSGVADLSGYLVAWGLTAGFNPATEGDSLTTTVSPAYINGLPAGTYYAKVAAFDVWSSQPGLLNFSAADAFTISTGSGGEVPPGGGGGGTCVTTDTPVLMADGTEKPAGELVAGDLVHTQHEHTLEWGDHEVTAVQIVDCDDVWQALGIKASGPHRVYVNGWVHMRDIGTPADPEPVVKITVADAHTYVSRGVLSHNIKMRDF